MVPTLSGTCDGPHLCGQTVAGFFMVQGVPSLFVLRVFLKFVMWQACLVTQAGGIQPKTSAAARTHAAWKTRAHADETVDQGVHPVPS